MDVRRVSGSRPGPQQPPPDAVIEEETFRPVFVHVSIRPTVAVEYASRGAEALAGLDDRAIVLGPRRLLRLLSRADRHRVLACIRDPHCWRERIELDVIGADGTVRPIEAWFAPQLDTASNLIAVGVAARRLNA